MQTVIIASNNKHKVDEIKSVLSFPQLKFMSLREAGIESNPEENAPDFLGNAKIKAYGAKAAFERAVGNFPEKLETTCFLADDSGLEVESLGGNPGVMSARYAGENATDAQNNAKLLRELTGKTAKNRKARFVCQLVFLMPQVNEIHATGEVKGIIASEPKGENGFGYDPLFLPEKFNYTCSMAQISASEKNAISHRGLALVQLKEKLGAYYA